MSSHELTTAALIPPAALQCTSDPAPNKDCFGDIEAIFTAQMADRLEMVPTAQLKKLVQATMMSLIDHRGFLRISHNWAHLASGEPLFDWLHAWLKPQVCATGAGHIPRTGPCLLIANHPTGYADGTALYDLVRPIRPDLGVFVIAQMVEFNPRFLDRIVPVEQRPHKRGPSTSRRTLTCAKQAFHQGRLLTLFPAGRESRLTGRGIRDTPWQDTAVKLARRFRVPVLPVHIKARHSSLFYACRLLSRGLGDLQSLNELQKNYRRHYQITVGPTIEPSQLSGPANAVTAALQRYVEEQLPGHPDHPFRGR